VTIFRYDEIYCTIIPDVMLLLFTINREYYTFGSFSSVCIPEKFTPAGEE